MFRAIAFLIIGIVCLIVLATVLPPLLGTPNSAYQQALVREQIVRERNWTNFTTIATYIVLFLLGSTAVILVVAACVAMYLAALRATPQRLRQSDGSFALERVRVTITDPQTGRRKKTWGFLDPNRFIDPLMVWNPFQNNVQTFRGDYGQEHQERVAHALVAKQRIQAAVPGDLAHIAAAKAAGHARNFTIKNQPAPPSWIDRPQPRLPELPAAAQTITPAVQATMPDWRDAWERSTPMQWLVGYDTENGTECYFDLEQDTHCGIVGATGTGKTASLTMLMILLAIKHGMQVFILDGKGGADLSVFANHTEYAATDGISYQQQINALWNEFRRRRQLINQARCRSPEEYTAKTGDLMPRMLIVSEEFGRTWESVPQTGNQRGDLLNQMSDLMAMSRFIGFHMVFVDQRPKRWPDQILTNCKAKFAFKMDSRQAGVIGEQYAPNLPPRGAFVRDDVTYRAWDMSVPAHDLLRRLPPNRRQALLPQPEYGAQYIDPPPPPRQRASTPAPVVTVIPSVPATPEENEASRFQPIIDAYFAADPSRWHESPMSGASAVAETMARHANDGRTKDNFKSLAGKMLAEHRAQHKHEHKPAPFTPKDPANPTAWELLKMQFPDEPVFIPGSRDEIKPQGA